MRIYEPDAEGDHPVAADGTLYADSLGLVYSDEEEDEDWSLYGEHLACVAVNRTRNERRLLVDPVLFLRTSRVETVEGLDAELADRDGGGRSVGDQKRHPRSC